MIKYFIIILAAILIAAAGISIYAWQSFKEPIAYSEPADVHIPKNTTVNKAIDILNSNGLLQPSWLYKLAAKYFTKYEKRTLYAGYYSFRPGSTNLEVLESIFSGKQLNIARVTLPEGIGFERMAAILSRKASINKDDFLYYCRSDSLLEAHGINAQHIEGYLMPNTYEFFRKQDAGAVITKLIEAQNHIWEAEFAARAKAMELNRHEALTLASIIEAESPVPDERPTVSGVYHNRLRIGMLLQADPTVQYALGRKKRLLYRDLEVNSPYNTYKYPGLPPGPINNPSESSIRAALYPENHSYFYFVAVGDGSGRHNFARNLSGHNINRSIFKRNLRKNRN